MSPEAAGALIQAFGFPTAAVILILWAFLTEAVIAGKTHRRELADRDAVIVDIKAQRDEATGQTRTLLHTTDAAIAAPRRAPRVRP